MYSGIAPRVHDGMMVHTPSLPKVCFEFVLLEMMLGLNLLHCVMYAANRFLSIPCFIPFLLWVNGVLRKYCCAAESVQTHP